MKFKNYFIYFQLIKYRKYSLNIIGIIEINLIILIILRIQNSINCVCLCLVRYYLVTVLREKIQVYSSRHTYFAFSLWIIGKFMHVSFAT